MGAVCAIGHDLAAFRAALREGTVGVAPIDTIPTGQLSVPIAAVIRGLDMDGHLPARRQRMLDRAAQLAVIAGWQAMRQSGLETPQVTGGAVILAATSGQETLDAAYEQLHTGGRVHPLTVPRVMANAPASTLSQEFGMRGPCFAVASACASSSHAIGLAAQMIRAGMVEVAVTGGADASVTVGFLKGWEGLRVLSADACRPFSRNRSGLVIGEGAGILVLESAGHARRRGAAVLAEIAGFGMTADAADMTAPSAEGAGAAMTAALADAGCAPAEIGYVNAHGTGTWLNDRTEVAALRQVFGAHLDRLPVSATKSMIGHCMTAGGALEMIATVMALRDGVLPPTMGFAEPDPDCAIDCVPNAARAADAAVAMSNAFAFGGLNAVLVARKWAG